MARKKEKLSFRKAVRALLGLLLLALISFGVMLGALALAEKSIPLPQGEYDAIIVLGAQVWVDGTPSTQLEMRLEKALAQYQASPCPIISCGAQGENEPAPEGDVMTAWLIEHGVPESMAISETASYNTWQNIRHAKALLPENAQRVVVVTSDYHLPRALRICKDEGLHADGLGSEILPHWWLKNHAREVLAWCKYFMGKVLPIN